MLFAFCTYIYLALHECVCVWHFLTVHVFFYQVKLKWWLHCARARVIWIDLFYKWDIHINYCCFSYQIWVTCTIAWFSVLFVYHYVMVYVVTCLSMLNRKYLRNYVSVVLCTRNTFELNSQRSALKWNQFIFL